MAKILVIDDEAPFREGLIETLTDLHHSAVGVGSVPEGLRLLQEQKFDAVFVDFKMPGINGIDAISMIREKTSPHLIPIVMITAFVDSENTIAAMKLGAFDHLTKPVGRSDIEKILSSILMAYPSSSAKSERPKSSMKEHELVGQSPEIREVLKMIGRLSANETSALITGETGTGKELVAKAIHSNSARSHGPFMAVNCAAIPENLLESELFGHMKGSFTGATNDRKGSFQRAEGGTLFLDEIGDMSLGLQAKLLRALQEREIIPVGANKPIKINARFITATHQDLRSMVEKKEFREDLFYRLNVVEVHLPSLRDREGDIALLSEHFLDLSKSEFGSKSLSPEALKKLKQHSWPGNIRELKNVIERASVLSAGPVINEGDIRIIGNTPVESLDALQDLDLPTAVAQLERKMISKALTEASGNRSEAARKLGIQRQLLYTKIKEYGL